MTECLISSFGCCASAAALFSGSCNIAVGILRDGNAHFQQLLRFVR